MATHKTFFGRLLAGIVGIFGSIFSHVLSGAEQTFDALPQETKDALIHGSGVLDFINSEVDMVPADIEAGILAKFPDLTADSLNAGLTIIAQAFKLDVANGDPLTDVITKLKAYLQTLQGNTWDMIVQGMANILAIFLAPIGTKAGAITQLMEYVYQTFFAKKK